MPKLIAGVPARTVFVGVPAKKLKAVPPDWKIS